MLPSSATDTAYPSQMGLNLSVNNVQVWVNQKDVSTWFLRERV